MKVCFILLASLICVIGNAGAQQTSAYSLQFVAITPCRIADTRNANGPFGGPELSAGISREFDIPQSACGVPSTAVAYSFNVTVVPNSSLNYLTLWPTGQTQPNVSTLNSDGRVKANAAILPAGTSGGVNVYATDATQVILDIDGYFEPAGTNSAMAFYPLTPCRVADTRSPTAPLGGPFLSGGISRAFPVQSSNCGIPSTAEAYSLNVTAVPHKTLNYLTSWPTGSVQPYVSTLNSSTGVVTANAAILPAGSDGDISIFVSDEADVILDVNGYFAPPGTGGLALYTVTPCRVIDTRPAPFNGVLLVDVATSSCAPPSTAQGYVLNATAVPQGPLNYLTLWPAGETQPYVSTLNAADGAITSNMAIVPTLNGSVDSFSTSSSNLILDLTSYFAPTEANPATGSWNGYLTSTGGATSSLAASLALTGSTISGVIQISGDQDFDASTPFAVTGTASSTGEMTLTGTQSQTSFSYSGQLASDQSNSTGSYSVTGAASDKGSGTLLHPPLVSGVYSGTFQGGDNGTTTLSLSLTPTVVQNSASITLSGTGTVDGLQISCGVSPDFTFSGTQSGTIVSGQLIQNGQIWANLGGYTGSNGSTLTGHAVLTQGICSDITTNGTLTNPSATGGVVYPSGDVGAVTVIVQNIGIGTGVVNVYGDGEGSQPVFCPAAPTPYPISPIVCGTVVFPDGTNAILYDAIATPGQTPPTYVSPLGPCGFGGGSLPRTAWSCYDPLYNVPQAGTTITFQIGFGDFGHSNPVITGP